MRKRFKNFEELVKENKKIIIEDQKALSQIEEKMDKKHDLNYQKEEMNQSV
ncbi:MULTISPECIES: FbpB family small basic protein [Salipaludibacillus]|nr:FbpB family small basic protein [Salipaludibacillus neizhouensis]